MEGQTICHAGIQDDVWNRMSDMTSAWALTYTSAPLIVLGLGAGFRRPTKLLHVTGGAGQDASLSCTCVGALTPKPAI